MSNLSRDFKKFLRDLYGFTNIQQTYSIFGVKNADKAYDFLFKEYEKENKKIIKEESAKKAAVWFKNEVKKVQIKKKKRLNAFELESQKFERKIELWNKTNNKQNNKFEIKIKSTKAHISKTFKFNNLSHFYNWLEKVRAIDSNGSDIQSNNYVDDNLFSGYIIIEKISIIKGGCNKHAASIKKIKTSFYSYELYNPTSMNNNCLFACLSYLLKYQVNTKQLRNKFALSTGSAISINDAYKIINDLNIDLQIVDRDYNEELDEDKKYLFYDNNHYYIVKSFEDIKRKDNKTKRGLLAFDFETRPTEDYHLIKASNTKSYILKDTICCLYYKQYKSNDFKELALITNNETSSARQFIDWLNNEAQYNRSYNIIAHNGGKFDFYFFISSLTDKELLECDIQMRGITIIGINYRGNLFKDSCCFLTDSLSNLSKSFKVERGKICLMTLHGKEITSSQLCFYRPELTFNQFLELQHNDTEFWDLYIKYCIYDCIALYEIWNKFTDCVNSLIEKINPYLLRKCPLMSSNTIGSHSKKILVELNKYQNKENTYKQLINEFTGVYYEEERNDKPMSEAQEWSVDNGKLPRSLFYRNVKKVDNEKYNFLCEFKRGGISHSHQQGKHMSGITGVDIASQYPASLLYSYIPCGKSYWVNEYDKTKKGFYLLNNLTFNSYLLKPVAKTTTASLNWSLNEMSELYIDSYTLAYVIDNYGLEKFEVVKGLVSDSDILGEKLFGKYINTFYDEKKLQDKYKTEKNSLYNEALRSTIKLYLNSLTGKLVENPSIHFSMKFDENSTKKLNGVGVSKEFNEDKFNDWIVTGLMVYSYSKRLLFEYIKCLPNNSNDVIHIETDGIYFSTRHLDSFNKNLENYKGDYPCKFGEDLGNLKIEKTTYEGQVAYFLGKKFYCITMEDHKNIYRVKGIPQSTIDKHGNSIKLVGVDLYEDIYNGKSVSRTFQTLRKSLFTQQTTISSHTLTRTIKPNGAYQLFV